jgi:phosphoribosylamine--glycine ligase
VTGAPVHGLADAERDPDVVVLHAGTRSDDAGGLVTAGGRLLSVTAVGADVAAARAKAYEAVAAIRIDGSHHRTDIAAGV